MSFFILLSVTAFSHAKITKICNSENEMMLCESDCNNNHISCLLSCKDDLACSSACSRELQSCMMGKLH